MKYAAPARKEIGLRSIFNMLGPLTNPAAANCQLLGVYAPKLTEMFAEALKLLGAKRAFVVHGHDGLDEISICAPTRVSELKDDVIRTYDISPEQFFDKTADPKDLVGGTAEENADITRRILSGEKGPCRDVVLINASAALMAAGMVKDFNEGIEAAAAAIDQGKASQKLADLVDFTQKTSA
jgi:anthranilate phosphoribosyltransferase